MIEFPPLAEADVPLVAEWLRQEHVALWWREPVEEAIEKRWAGIEEWLLREHVAPWWRDDIGESIAEYRSALEGREPTDHFLIEVDGRPVGMIQTYLVSDYPEWEEVVQVGAGVAGVDLMIGEGDLVGAGLGPRVLAQFARDVIFTRAGVDAVVATVEEPNRRSWRAFEKAGFRHVRDVEEDGLPCRLMRLDRRAVAF